jgi:hypothetical protein
MVESSTSFEKREHRRLISVWLDEFDQGVGRSLAAEKGYANLLMWIVDDLAIPLRINGLREV